VFLFFDHDTTTLVSLSSWFFFHSNNKNRFPTEIWRFSSFYFFPSSTLKWKSILQLISIFYVKTQINMSHFREIKTKCFRQQVVLDDLRWDRAFQIVVAVVFKVIFTWKYIKIIFFLFLKSYFWHQHIKIIWKY